MSAQRVEQNGWNSAFAWLAAERDTALLRGDVGRPHATAPQLSRTGNPSPSSRPTGLVERQADDGGVGADEFDHEGAGEPLDRVAARLAAPFAGGEVALDLPRRQPLEAHAGLDQPLATLSLGREEADGGVDAVRRPDSNLRHLGLVGQLGLGQDAPADRHTVSAETMKASRMSSRRARRLARRLGLGAGETAGMFTRALRAFSGVSSTSAGSRTSGSMPTCCSSARRRGDAEARTSRVGGAAGPDGAVSLIVAGQPAWRQLYQGGVHHQVGETSTGVEAFLAPALERGGAAGRYWKAAGL